MEMIKEDVIYRKARKGVKQTAQHSGRGALYKTADVKIGRKGRKGKFKHKQRAHKIRHHPVGEGEGHPKEGAAQKIKGIIDISFPPSLVLLELYYGEFVYMYSSKNFMFSGEYS